jgi:ribosome biogenesis GTPase / thiamine phosphate phosphatase
MRLEDLGWDASFSSAFEAFARTGLRPGRISRTDRRSFRVLTGQDELHAEASGKLRYRTPEWPVTGDWVVLRGDSPVIDAVLPRKTELSRKTPGEQTEKQVLAANVDVLFLVTGLDRDFNPRRIERWLLLAGECGAQPVIVLNKADLHPDPNWAADEVRRLAPAVPVTVISALAEQGTAELIRHVRHGETAALLGSSGVGKSTIVNWLLGRDSQPTQEVREDDGRGRHTTTSRELIPMPGGWLLMDTPGLRELQLWAREDGLDQTFEDVASFAALCRFRDCRHEGEPGCAVTEAVSGGDLDEKRLGSYRKLQRELAYLARLQDERAAAEEKRRWKRIHKAMRHGGNRL